MIPLSFKPVAARPPDWRSAGATRPSTPFYSSYATTMAQLQDELRRIGAVRATLQVETPNGEGDVRNDGQLRANAKVVHPGVILTIETRAHGILVYDTDRFPHWHTNLRAITLGLEALRKIERYGIAKRGQQTADLPADPDGLLLALGRFAAGRVEVVVWPAVKHPLVAVQWVQDGRRRTAEGRALGPALRRALREARRVSDQQGRSGRGRKRESVG